MSDAITLNSVRYVLRGPIERFKVEATAPVVNPSGRLRANSITGRQSLVFPAPTCGIGLRRIPTDRIDNPVDIRRSWDSRVETRFSQVTLPLLRQDSTEPTTTNFQRYRASVEFLSELIMLGEAGGVQIPAVLTSIRVYSYTGSTTAWTEEGTVEIDITGAAEFVGLHMVVVGSRAIVLYAKDSDHVARFATALGTWTAATTPITAGLLVNNVTDGEDIDAGKLAVIGLDVYAILWNEDNLRVDIFRSTDQGTNWTSFLASAAPTGSGVKGAATYYDLNGDPAPVFCTEDGVYAIDTSATVVQKLLKLPSSADNGRGMMVWSNPHGQGDSLYIPLGSGDILEYTWIGGTGGYALVRNVGPTKNDGLPAEAQGFVTAMVGSPRWLFYAYGGAAASRNARIFAWDGQGTRLELDGCGHHFMARHGTANQRITFLALSPRDDDTMRLHYAVRLTATTSDSLFLASPLTDPASGASLNYEDGATGGAYLERPETNFGLPRENGALLAVYVEGRDISAEVTGEYINENYGADGATPTTDIGNILSGTLELALASGAGVAGRSFQLREELNRSATNTLTPKLIATEVMYRKKIPSLNGYRCVVDVLQSQAPEQRPAETVLADLETAEALNTLAAFTYRLDTAGAEVTEYVNVKILGWTDAAGRRVAPYEIQPEQVVAVAIELREEL